MTSAMRGTRPPASLAPVARLAGQVRSPEFLEGLGKGLEDYFPDISHVVFHFPSGGRPTVLASNLSAELDRRVLMPYVERMYLLDPFYRHWQIVPRAGLWTLDEIAPAGFRDSDYFATYYRDLGLYDEAAAFFPLGQGSACRCPSVSTAVITPPDKPNSWTLWLTCFPCWRR
ncbi:hypothetical protein A8U91_01070 [Halomonas elongata]|uniref:Uncharacterized protein n=1 Tax=Halomonas elongata TaxID=2746 RepID=A0A1B8P3F5_HALEL|nr:hypothetical protein [Halomonas elongata]OBX36723.1 hypothetical protein A8U91_01070 [Halomonas elongata]